MCLGKKEPLASNRISFEFNTPYTILSNSGLSLVGAEQFSRNSIDEVELTFSIDGDSLVVTFLKK